MPDEWDVYPGVEPPYYAHLERFGNRNLSAEEVAAEKERISKEYERRCAQAHHDWLPRRVELVKTKIKFLRRCQKGQAPERRGLGCVYLMRCPSLTAYKIGYTDDLYQRIINLRQQLDPQIECHTSYHTPVSLALLEKVLHRHFSYFHFPSEKSDELFKLPQEEVVRFAATTGVIERHLLAVEILRLKALLSKFEEDLKEVK